MYRPAAHIQDDELYLPAGQLGMGWWGDAWDEVKSVAKKVQANPVVRGLEKKAVDYGSKALRGAAESAVDGLDSRERRQHGRQRRGARRAPVRCAEGFRRHDCDARVDEDRDDGRRHRLCPAAAGRLGSAAPAGGRFC